MFDNVQAEKEKLEKELEYYKKMSKIQKSMHNNLGSLTPLGQSRGNLVMDSMEEIIVEESNREKNHNIDILSRKKNSFVSEENEDNFNQFLVIAHAKPKNAEST